MGCAYEMEQLLDWAEAFQKHTILPQHVAELERGSHMLNLEARRLDRELWSFLNLNLTGEAKKTFDSVPLLHGFEAWRQIVVPIEPRTLHRKMGMYTDVHHPPRAKNLGEVTASGCVRLVFSIALASWICMEVRLNKNAE